MGAARYGYRVNRRRILTSTSLAAVLVTAFAAFSGRLSAGLEGVLPWAVAIAGCAVLFPWWILRQQGQVAMAAGEVEVDDAGLRWRRGDGTLVGDLPWPQVKAVLTHPRGRPRQVVVQPLEGAAWLFGQGGWVELADLDGLEKRLVEKVTPTAFDVAPQRALAPVAWRSAAALLVLCAALALTNLVVAPMFAGGTRGWWALPGVTLALAALMAWSARTLSRGEAAMVNGFDPRRFQQQLLRLLFTFALADLALAWALNHAP